MLMGDGRLEVKKVRFGFVVLGEDVWGVWWGYGLVGFGD